MITADEAGKLTDKCRTLEAEIMRAALEGNRSYVRSSLSKTDGELLKSLGYRIEVRESYFDYNDYIIRW